MSVLPRLLAILLLVTAACAPTSGADDALEIVAAVYPLAWAAQHVAPDATVTSLGARGQDPHDLELTPQQRGLFERADVIAYLGLIDFQPQVEAAVAGTPATVVDAAEIAGEDRLLQAGDHGHADDDAPTDSDVIDPHLWFDAAVMADIVLALGDAVAQADPDGAQAYRARAAEAAGDLLALNEEIATKLNGCEHSEVIVSHEAYAYLLGPHALVQHGISGAAGHSEASPSDIAGLAAEVREEGIPAVLSEPVEGRTDAEAVAREAGVDVIDIYSLDIVEPQQAAKAFPTLLREQAHAVAQAAQCAGAA